MKATAKNNKVIKLTFDISIFSYCLSKMNVNNNNNNDETNETNERLAEGLVSNAYLQCNITWRFVYFGNSKRALKLLFISHTHYDQLKFSMNALRWFWSLQWKSVPNHSPHRAMTRSFDKKRNRTKANRKKKHCTIKKYTHGLCAFVSERERGNRCKIASLNNSNIVADDGGSNGDNDNDRMYQMAK